MPREYCVGPDRRFRESTAATYWQEASALTLCLLSAGIDGSARSGSAHPPRNSSLVRGRSAVGDGIGLATPRGPYAAPRPATADGASKRCPTASSRSSRRGAGCRRGACVPIGRAGWSRIVGTYGKQIPSTSRI